MSSSTHSDSGELLCTAVVDGIPCRRVARARKLCPSHYRHWRENPGRELRLLRDQGVPEGHRRCGDCGQVKPVSEFKPYSRGYRGAKSWCRRCDAIHSDTYRFGVPHGYREAQWERQDRCCGICLRVLHLHETHIDHDHVTGRTRGLLCQHCNQVEGHIPPDEGMAREWLERFLAWRRG